MGGKPGELCIGGVVDAGTGKRTGNALVVDSADLTTHAVIVGMTGSGKTGLGVVLLEEALRAGVPSLVLDPKGDMGNLLLEFPDLAPADFAPWVDADAARREGITPDDLAARTAETWREGLAGWDLGGDDIRALKQGSEAVVYSPGSTMGVPLDLVGSLAAPGLDWDMQAETLRDEIEGLVSGLMTLAGHDADPVSDPGHILLATVIENEWRAGRSLDMASLIGLVQNPPIRKLGVFPLEQVIPEKERRALAMSLNSLVASPSFSSWMQGQPVDIGALLWTPDGRPRAAVVYLAHLSEPERQFVVTLLLGRFVTWMRQQPGTSALRALIYMDEMFGFAPPTAAPPSKKPILTLFKQARAYGVGFIAATQNPVDLDYKAMSNAGTWMIGRLQTERDKARILEGLSDAAGGTDASAMDTRLSGLRKREFVLRSTHVPEPVVFTTRWAMAYLRGTLTREEIIRLRKEREARVGAPGATSPAGSPAGSTSGAAGAAAASISHNESAPTAPSADESVVAPPVASSVPVRYLDPSASWSDDVGAVPGSVRLGAALVARVGLLFDDAKAGIEHREEWEAVYFPLPERFDPAAGIAVDYDDRDLRPEPPDGARYVLPRAPVGDAAYFRDAQRAIIDWLVRERTVEVQANRELGLYSRVGESADDFRARCAAAASTKADEETAKLKERYASRIDRVKDVLARAEDRLREVQVDASSRKQQELIAGAGQVLSMFLRGRSSARSLSGFASRRSMTRRTEERMQTAEGRVAEEQAELADLEKELGDEVQAIVGRWEDAASKAETVKIPLEKSDVSVEQVGLVWIGC